MQDFSKLGVSEPLQHALKKNGISQPTPIQVEAIPHILAGKDLMAQAQTGTGKTISFILPILEKINVEQEYIQSLIVAPTRELAIQITNEFQKYKSDLINVLAVYGGQDVERQLKRLAGTVHIVVGTPGRILDHLRRETIQLQNVSMLVLDEADQMLHIGFINEVEDIIKETSFERQTMLFSATLTDQVKSLAKKYMRLPVSIKVADEYKTLEEIEQLVYETTDRQKQASLCKILDEHRPFLAVIFCRTKRRADKLYDDLKGLGYNCDVLHGDLSQPKREKVMERFRKAEIQYLIATDVASRGLDVEGVTHVFNYDVPEDVDSYIHRIGRTGRAGSKGLAITFVAPKDFQQLKLIEKEIGMTLERREKLDHVSMRDNSKEEGRPRRNSTSTKASSSGSRSHSKGDHSSRRGGRTASKSVSSGLGRKNERAGRRSNNR
ncbi:ATP-dependent RNA helicase DeaD [Bacillus mesophilus]|uniref:DEAD/DEAH box helicase n=1 Tax=Bacillus mesophilus TaxID=1808955 RepID=A0A6M0QB48_9BACI|nr:DEAD/DEAH box helicase [Bacillus mesophilus]MBM7663097.1 ATP-dependent RNA helicase DeaD [Bacillus mesophilus]NEY73584.1 DEAD/DEAH box helicase [Bacillus mesophilus]